MRYVKLAAFTAALLAAGTALPADPYPAKPVRVIVATGPGGVDDFCARQVASKLGEILASSSSSRTAPVPAA